MKLDLRYIFVAAMLLGTSANAQPVEQAREPLCTDGKQAVEKCRALRKRMAQMLPPELVDSRPGGGLAVIPEQAAGKKETTPVSCPKQP
ncbi:MAG: hypothetical protein H0V46_00295 [Sphingomonas sp.]|nr:hypothetical protein [Sphingomonas sp.]